MIVKTVKKILLDDAELMTLRQARDVLMNLNDELSDDNIDDLVYGLEQFIYSEGWQIETED